MRKYITNESIQKIPVGLCGCGCGGSPTIATRTSVRDNSVKGQPVRFCRGHNKPSLRPIEERLWEKIDRQGNGECWLWTASTNLDGYGHIGFNGKLQRATRIIWELYRGPIPDGLEICHTCDNPACMNYISHLFLGTHKQNMQDMMRKGRRHAPQGEGSGMSKLTEKEVLEIRHRFAQGETNRRKLAGEYHVSNVLVGLIIRRKIWTHI